MCHGRGSRGHLVRLSKENKKVNDNLIINGRFPSGQVADGEPQFRGCGGTCAAV